MSLYLLAILPEKWDHEQCFWENSLARKAYYELKTQYWELKGKQSTAYLEILFLWQDTRTHFF